jgi:hypothetical protein
MKSHRCSLISLRPNESTNDPPSSRPTCNVKFRNEGRYMLDGVSLDQLRTFLAAADEGSFSAAGRRLRRARSVVSQSLANLEGQLGVKLSDRSGHQK